MKNCKMLLFDLDGTLLRDDKTISERTLLALRSCREAGIRIGVSTSRGEHNVLPFVEVLQPDILIASGGAVVKARESTLSRTQDQTRTAQAGRLREGYLYAAEFSGEETRDMIAAARKVCGGDCEITIDTIEAHYWNYRIDPRTQDESWGDAIYTDYKDFAQASLKMCVEIFDERQAEQLQKMLPDCDCLRYSDGHWYKFTKKEATKEHAILEVCDALGIKTEEITAFGDDYVDIGMLELCGTGIAMGNAIEQVKERADLVIGSNEEDGIAIYLEEHQYD